MPKKPIQFKNGQKTWTNISPKMICRWPTDTWKDAQHHSPSGKCKSKLQWDITSHGSEWLKLTTQETDVGKYMKKKELLCNNGGNANSSASIVVNNLGFPHKIKYRSSIWSSNSTAGYLPKEYENTNLKDTCIPMFAEILFLIAKLLKQFKHPSIGERIRRGCGDPQVAQRFSATFGPGHDPGVPGPSTTSGSLHGACFSLCLCRCVSAHPPSLSLSLSHK